MKTLGLITARKGSKGIPGKNIKMINNKPLISWTIEQALDSQVLDDIVISTDSEEIIEIGKTYGIKPCFTRPESLSQDSSSHIDVVLHSLSWLEKNKYLPQYVMLLQPTSPLRTAQDIKNCINIAKDSDLDSIVSISKTPVHPFQMKKISTDGMIYDYEKKPNKYIPRQDHPNVFFTNGAIYLTKAEIILKQKTFFPKNTIGYEMPYKRSIDIDDEFDFFICDKILKENKI